MSILGYIIGNNDKEVSYKISYKTLPPKDSIIYVSDKNIVSEYKPSNLRLIFTYDTIYNDTGKVIIQQVDTNAILSDWNTRRKYHLDVFDIDTIGKLSIDQVVQYNKLDSFHYRFTPITRVQTNIIDKKSKLRLFGGIGLSTNDYYNIQVGVFKGHFGGSYQYNRQFNGCKDFHSLNLLFTF